MEIIEEQDELGINGKILVLYRCCEICNKGLREKEMTQQKFINLGSIEQNEQFICTCCANKINISGEKLVHDNFGWHFEKS